MTPFFLPETCLTFDNKLVFPPLFQAPKIGGIYRRLVFFPLTLGHYSADNEKTYREDTHLETPWVKTLRYNTGRADGCNYRLKTAQHFG